jgi:hypothetical protein
MYDFGDHVFICFIQTTFEKEKESQNLDFQLNSIPSHLA